MRIFDRKPALRWMAPAALVVVIGGTGGLVATTATADPQLPTRTAAELLVALQKANVDAMSGKVVQTSDLGIPDLPGVGGRHKADFTSLISGTHSMGVWYSGPDKARIALYGAEQGTLDEADIFRNGSDVWTWSYKDKTATHRTLPNRPTDKSAEKQPGDLPKTPEEAADQALKAIDPTTTVSTDKNVQVAGRDAYELVLEPKTKDSLVTQVRIAIDGEKLVPLRVEVFAGDVKAFETGFTSVDFTRPDDAQFRFVPPAGTKVTEIPPSTEEKSGSPDKKHSGKADKPAGSEQPKVVGSGWSTVVVTKVPAGDAESATGQLGQVLNALPEVSGDWGSGRPLSGTAFSAVLTDDGRLAVGSVKPELLYKALAK